MSRSNKGAGVDSRLQNVANALFVNQYDDVVMRSHVDGITLQGDVIVDAVKIWDGTHYAQLEQPSNDGETGGWSISTENYNMVFNGSTWDRMRGNIVDGVLTQISNDYLAISKDTNANSDSNRIYVNATGTVSLAAGTTVNISDNGGSITVDGSVSITGPVEIKNDIDNPIPISRNTDPNGLMNPVYVHFGRDTDVGNFTSKNRLRVSGYQVNWHNTFQYTKADDFWDGYTHNGATATWDQAQSSVVLATSSTVGSKVIRQSRQVMPYIPGRPAEFSVAIQWFSPTPGVRARVGMFDENNGFYFEQGNDGNYYVVIRSSVSGSPVERRVARADWNGDKFDGNGPSGITANPDTIQLMVVNYEWYGAGQVTFSYVMDGVRHSIHTFNNANEISDVWMSTPFQPIRIEVENISGNTAKQIWQSSSSWALEGDQAITGVPMVIGHVNQTLTDKDTYYPAISVRLKSTCLNSVNILKRFQSVTPSGNTILYWKLVLNPTLTGASWQDHPIAQSTMQYDISATASSGGTVINEGVAYLDGTQFDLDPLANAFQLARNSLQTTLASDTVTLILASTTQNVKVTTYLRWREMR